MDVAEACTAVNQGALTNPELHLALGDARELIATARRRYDVICSEPSNPYRAGVASLFAQEFYQSALQALTDDGRFVQWVQGYEADSATVKAIYATC